MPNMSKFLSIYNLFLSPAIPTCIDRILGREAKLWLKDTIRRYPTVKG